MMVRCQGGFPYIARLPLGPGHMACWPMLQMRKAPPGKYLRTSLSTEQHNGRMAPCWASVADPATATRSASCQRRKWHDLDATQTAMMLFRLPWP